MRGMEQLRVLGGRPESESWLSTDQLMTLSTTLKIHKIGHRAYFPGLRLPSLGAPEAVCECSFPCLPFVPVLTPFQG